MKKHILNLGTPLDKQQQKAIKGGKAQCIYNDHDPSTPPGTCIEYGLHCAEPECRLLPFPV